MPQKKDFTSVYICDVRVQEFHKCSDQSPELLNRMESCSENPKGEQEWAVHAA